MGNLSENFTFMNIYFSIDGYVFMENSKDGLLMGLFEVCV